MRIENKEYIKLNISENLYFYIIKDYENLKYLISEKNFKLKNIERKIYFKFLEYIEKEYNLKIKEINNIKEDLIYYEIKENNILFNIIEDLIY